MVEWWKSDSTFSPLLPKLKCQLISLTPPFPPSPSSIPTRRSRSGLSVSQAPSAVSVRWLVCTQSFVLH